MPTKLRASCDACHFAKIKCIKTERDCQRCDASGEQCSYSPAQPRIYHKRKNRSSGSHSSTPTTSGSSVSASTADHVKSPAMSSMAQRIGTQTSSIPATLDSQIYNPAVSEPIGLVWPYLPQDAYGNNRPPDSELLGLDLLGADNRLI